MQKNTIIYSTIPQWENKFWKYVKKTDTCWLWTSKIDRDGYGRFWIGRGHQRKDCSVHRLSWSLHYGLIPEGLCVAHKCDVRNCVRPDHLFLATFAENNADCIAKGRKKVGECCGRAKLTTCEVVQIRKQYTHQHMQIAQIARDYNVSEGCVDHVVHFRTWRHVTNHF